MSKYIFVANVCAIYKYVTLNCLLSSTVTTNSHLFHLQHSLFFFCSIVLNANSYTQRLYCTEVEFCPLFTFLYHLMFFLSSANFPSFWCENVIKLKANYEKMCCHLVKSQLQCVVVFGNVGTVSRQAFLCWFNNVWLQVLFLSL